MILFGNLLICKGGIKLYLQILDGLFHLTGCEDPGTCGGNDGDPSRRSSPNKLWIITAMFFSSQNDPQSSCLCFVKYTGYINNSTCRCWFRDSEISSRVFFPRQNKKSWSNIAGIVTKKHLIVVHDSFKLVTWYVINVLTPLVIRKSYFPICFYLIAIFSGSLNSIPNAAGRWNRMLSQCFQWSMISFIRSFGLVQPVMVKL